MMPFVVGLIGFLIGALAFALLAIIEFGAWALVSPPRAPSAEQQTGGAAEDQSRQIRALAGDGARLAGIWHPALTDDETGRTVLLLHGFAEASAALQEKRVAALNRTGWNAAALDLRGYGKSDGAFASFGAREAGDVRAWIDVLVNRLGYRHHLLPVLWGRSMGAAVALRAAAEGTRIKALILESPMVDLDDSVAAWFRKRRFPFPLLLARLVTSRGGALAGVSLTSPGPIDLAPQVRCPVLIVHGSDDTLVQGDEARRLADAFPSPPRFIEVPGAGHTDVVQIGGDEVLEQIARFLRKAVP
jgi:alpha-beta hydrolase superfamily lysophospholipase